MGRRISPIVCSRPPGRQLPRVGWLGYNEFLMLHLLEQHGPKLQAWFADQGLGGYRASQVRRWLFQRRAAAFDEMTDLPKTVRRQLADEFQIWTARIAARRQAEDGTEKLLLELFDGQRTECVLLRDDREHCAVCISTQVGCAMRCASAPAALAAWCAT